ncbi:integrase catalytic domain-containing protein [Trichonephila clavipes]|nr:integrase catalytic domain-containing protein [Trichonephila clavipes]
MCDYELFCEYKDVIDDYVREGIVERTSCDSLLDSQGFYLPHHAVIRSDKTTSRIRIVFDGSAHEDRQSSLNQSLYTGPNLHPSILELLLCFRKSPVAFTANVKSAFLQIELDFRDRDFTRFFWTDNLNNEPYVLNFTRVLFGLRPSPYLLAATLKHHFKKYREQYPHTFQLLNCSIYVDDLICGQNDVPDALRTTLECLQIFSDAGMLLRKWRSNSKQLNLLWQQEGVKTESSETSVIDLRPPTKVLGLVWDTENDLIYFDPKDLLFMSRRGESKRFILSVVGRIFDPIGILGPFVIKLKCLFQELWTLGVEWDSELPPKLRHKWQQWSSEAEGLTEIKIPRFYLDKGIHWKFIVERAPWWGGFYERLVKTIKDPLRKILGRALLTFEELSTILSEVEVIVNHRPLTYVENDPGKPEPLTPAHFLELGYGDSKYPIHFIELIDATTTKESYKKRKTYRTLILRQLWRRWKEQYLLQKEDLINVLKEIGEQATSKEAIIQLKTKLEKTATFKDDPDFMINLLHVFVEDKQTRAEQQLQVTNSQLEMQIGHQEDAREWENLPPKTEKAQYQKGELVAIVRTQFGNKMKPMTFALMREEE